MIMTWFLNLLNTHLKSLPEQKGMQRKQWEPWVYRGISVVTIFNDVFVFMENPIIIL